MTCCAVRWQDATADAAGAEGHARPRRVRPRWHGWEIALMVTGFVVFWPVGLAILFWILWKKRHGDRTPLPQWLARFIGGGAPASGNSAFQAWKQGELDRLEQERRKLAEAEQEFAAFLDQLKRARDREEFERFMAGRSRPGADPQPA